MNFVTAPSFLDWLFDDAGWEIEKLREASKSLSAGLNRAHANDRDFASVVDALCRQNQELRVRLGVLIRLLVERAVISPEELAGEVAKAKEAIAKTTTRKLPKPPRKLGKKAAGAGDGG